MFGMSYTKTVKKLQRSFMIKYTFHFLKEKINWNAQTKRVERTKHIERTKECILINIIKHYQRKAKYKKLINTDYIIAIIKLKAKNDN